MAQASPSAMEIQWTALEPLPDAQHGTPVARSCHGLTCVSPTRLILYGGEHVARTPLPPDQALWSCDWMPHLEDGLVAAAAHDGKGYWQWRLLETKGAPAPEPRVGHAQALVDNKLYVFGGRTGVDMGETALNDLWCLNLETDQWEKCGEGASVPEARSFHAMTSMNGSLYVFGGCGATSGRLADLHKWDPSTRAWTFCGTSLLQGRGGANLIAFDPTQTLAVLAGFCGFETNDGQLFDASTQSWHTNKIAEDGQDPSWRPRSVCISGYLPSVERGILFGGEVNPSDRAHEGAGSFENDMVFLDPKTGQVLLQMDAPGTNWPERRGWSSGTVRHVSEKESSLYLFGGLTGDDSHPQRLGDLWKCEISL